MYWLVYSFHKDQELNSCLEEGSKNFAVTSNKPNFLTKLSTHHMVSGIFTQIFQLTAINESQVVNEGKLFPWTLCGFGLAWNK